MKLNFLLQLEGHRGYPDSEWTRTAVLDADDSTTVEAGAKKLVQEEYMRHSRDKEMPDEYKNLTVKQGTDYIEVTLPGEERYGDLIRYTLAPVLTIGERHFLLTEAEL